MRDQTWFEETMFVYNERDAIEKEALLSVVFNFAHDDEENVLKLLKKENPERFKKLCKRYHVDPETFLVDEDYVKDRLYND